MTIGEKIQALRKQKGLSQEDLSARMEVSRQAISKWEMGESIPDVNNIMQLSEIFNVTTDYILRNGEQPAISAPSPSMDEEKPTKKPPGNMFSRLLFIASGVGIVLSSVDGVLWPLVADMLFGASLYVVILGMAGLKNVRKSPMPEQAVFGAKVILVCFLVISVSGVYGFLGRDRVDVILVFMWFTFFVANAIIFYACIVDFFRNRKKAKADIIDLRTTPSESDVNLWKN